MASCSEFCVSFKSYQRKLKTPLKMSRGTIDSREGVIVCLEDGQGGRFYGEALILPHFGTESLEQACLFLSTIAECSESKLREIPEEYPAVRFALESALLLCREPEFGVVPGRELAVSKLLPVGEASLSVLGEGLRQGYRVFKWKIGISPLEDDFRVLSKILERFGPDNRLRLDANGGLSKQQAEIWLKRCEGTQVEFLEQPLHPGKLVEMMELAKLTSTRIALDESVATMDEVEAVYEQGWRGLFAVKPLRLGSVSRFLKWRERTQAEIVYSTALETAVGTEIGLRLAYSDLQNSYALGFGVSHWFEDDAFSFVQDGPLLFPGRLSSGDYYRLWQHAGHC